MPATGVRVWVMGASVPQGAGLAAGECQCLSLANTRLV